MQWNLTPSSQSQKLGSNCKAIFSSTHPCPHDPTVSFGISKQEHGMPGETPPRTSPFHGCRVSALAEPEARAMGMLLKGPACLGLSLCTPATLAVPLSQCPTVRVELTSTSEDAGLSQDPLTLWHAPFSLTPLEQLLPYLKTHVYMQSSPLRVHQTFLPSPCQGMERTPARQSHHSALRPPMRLLPTLNLKSPENREDGSERFCS